MTVELPFHLKTLPPEALDVIRYFTVVGSTETADVDAICEGTGLSERGFSKAIKRLVTKGYAQMESGRVYRLTDQGVRASEELSEYDANAPEEDDTGSGYATFSRRLLLAVPRSLVANQPTNVYVGFEAAADDESLANPAEIVVRLAIVNGEPKAPQDEIFALEDEPAHAVFAVTAGDHTKARLRLNVFQLGPNPDDINPAGGMYIDLDIVKTAADNGTLVAYATNVPVMAF
jgi:predicted transcriptional regulator